MDRTKTGLLEIYSDEWRIKALRLGRKFIQGRGYRVYYPGSSTDVSPSKAFPESLVYYLDRDPHVVKSLRTYGYRVANADANRAVFKKNADIILIFNSGTDPGHVCTFLREGGCLFCDNRVHTAIRARLVEDLKHVAALRKEGESIVVDEDENCLWEYWQSIETEEEFIHADITGGMRRAVRRFCQSDEDYLRNYRELYSRAIPDSIQHELSSMRDAPAYGSPGYTPETYMGPVFANPKDASSCLLPLPMKRGNADTIFVFRKV